MRTANFCFECGERLSLKGWRALLGRKLCDRCAQRLGTFTAFQPLIAFALIAASAFGLGRYLRPSPPPLLIQRVANSPLSDGPIAFDGANSSNRNRSNVANQNQSGYVNDEEVYICGARTKKGTPCRRRVHFAGERCYQHKGMPAMVPIEKLVVKSK